MPFSTERVSARARPRSIAIVGGGPRALQGLERLVANNRGIELEIDVYEPTGQFGSGAVYRSGQPSYLRMNFADDLVDAWVDDCPGTVDLRFRRSFTEWCDVGGCRDPAGYAARSLVGSYLRDCFDLVLSSVPPTITVNCRSLGVDRLDRADGGWLVTADDVERHYQEVLLVTGHRRSNPPFDSAAVALDYPLHRRLGVDRAPPGSGVRVRGIALTFIDLTLELTEGRNGRFEGPTDGACIPIYHPSGQEPHSIVGFSRTGRMMLVKPVPGSVVNRELATELCTPWEGRLLALDDREMVAGLLRVVAGAASDLLRNAGPSLDGGSPNEVGPEVLTRLVEERISGAWGVDPVGELHRSWEIAVSQRAADGLWALGESWRRLYRPLVDRASHGGVRDTEWPAFAALSREMERLAFGPPPVNAAKLIALIDCGLVRVASEAAPRAVAIDAVLASPGAAEYRGDLVDQLRLDGHVRIAPGGRRGIEVDIDGSCVGADGELSQGLAALGRITEDWVIGNDTLSRELHRHPQRWADRVLAVPVRP